MTRCSQVTDRLLQLSLKLTCQQFTLLTGSLHPISLVQKLYLHHYLHSSRRSTGETGLSKSLPDISGLNIATSSVVSPPTQLSLALISLLKELRGRPASSITLVPPDSSKLPPANTALVYSQPESEPPEPECGAEVGDGSRAKTNERNTPNTCSPGNTTSVVSTATPVQITADKQHSVGTQTTIPLPPHPRVVVCVVAPLAKHSVGIQTIALPPVAAPLNTTSGNCQQPARHSKRQPRATKRFINWQTASAEKRRKVLPVGGSQVCENCDTGMLSCHRCKI